MLEINEMKESCYKGFLYKISSKLKKVKTNVGGKTSFIIKMSKSELMNSASEDENNGLKKVKHQMMNT